MVATNVANASTPGYVRRSLEVSEKILGGSTAGVQSDGVSRSENQSLTAERRNLTSDLAQADVLSSTWQTISSMIGDTAEGTGLFKSFGDFETALSNLALTPESGADAATVLSSANAIVTEFHDLSQMVVSLRTEADREIGYGRDIVNSALKTIETLNSQLSGMDRTTGAAAALVDERNRVLDTISEYIPVQAVPRNYGMIDVVTPEGVFLVAGTARQLEFNTSSSFGPGQTFENGALSGLSVDGIALTPGSPSYGAVSSGLFGALFTLRDQDLPTFSAQLDTLASDFISRLSDDAIDPTKTPGDPGMFVDSAGTGDPGLAGRIAINAAIDPAQGGATWRLRDGIGAIAQGPTGDSTILDKMLSAVKQVSTISSNGIQGAFSSTEMAAQLASLAGQKRLQNESILSSTTAQYTMIQSAEQSENGVDTDTEMQNLILIEQAYAANARVIEIAGQMINRLMEI